MSLRTRVRIWIFERRYARLRAKYDENCAHLAIKTEMMEMRWILTYA